MNSLGVSNRSYDKPQKIEVDHQIYQVVLSVQKAFSLHQRCSAQPGKIIISQGLRACRGPAFMEIERGNLTRLLRPFRNKLFITTVLGYYKQFGCSDQ